MGGPSAWHSQLRPFACALSGTAAQKLEAVSRGPTGQCGAVGCLRLILGALGHLLPSLTHVIHPGLEGGGARSRSQGSGGYSLAASIMLAQNRGCLCRGSIVGAAELVDVHAGWCTHAAIVAGRTCRSSAGGMGRCRDRGASCAPAVLAPSPITSTCICCLPSPPCAVCLLV